MAPEEARYAALREFGWAESIKETCREQRGVLWLEQFVQDVCYGLRTLRKNPGFTAVAAATLALGIGVNTAIFSIISSVLFSPLPYPDPDSLVEVNETHCNEARMAEHGVLVSNYRDWRAASRSFVYMGMYYYNLFSLTEGGQTRPVDGCCCSAEMLPALGVAPLLGRGLLEEDEQAGCVAVVGYDLWRRLFGSETNLTVKTLLVNTQRVDIIGVMPEGFNFPPRAELWMPLRGMGTNSAFNDGGFKIGSVIGSLGPGVGLAQAQSEMDGIARNIGARFPNSGRDCGARVSSLHAEMIARIRPTLPILTAAALFILLIACANLGNLLLSRCLVREKELAIRAAVGAGNGRLIRQFMAESLLLSFMGAAAGLVAVVLSRGVWLAWAGRIGRGSPTSGSTPRPYGSPWRRPF